MRSKFVTSDTCWNGIGGGLCNHPMIDFRRKTGDDYKSTCQLSREIQVYGAVCCSSRFGHWFGWTYSDSEKRRPVRICFVSCRPCGLIVLSPMFWFWGSLSLFLPWVSPHLMHRELFLKSVRSWWLYPTCFTPSGTAGKPISSLDFLPSSVPLWAVWMVKAGLLPQSWKDSHPASIINSEATGWQWGLPDGHDRDDPVRRQATRQHYQYGCRHECRCFWLAGFCHVIPWQKTAIVCPKSSHHVDDYIYRKCGFFNRGDIEVVLARPLCWNRAQKGKCGNNRITSDYKQNQLSSVFFWTHLRKSPVWVIFIPAWFVILVYQKE